MILRGSYDDLVKREERALFKGSASAPKAFPSRWVLGYTGLDKSYVSRRRTADPKLGYPSYALATPSVLHHAATGISGRSTESDDQLMYMKVQKLSTGAPAMLDLAGTCRPEVAWTQLGRVVNKDAGRSAERSLTRPSPFDGELMRVDIIIRRRFRDTKYLVSLTGLLAELLFGHCVEPNMNSLPY